ncbi:molybdopterin-binding protein [Arthrobacter sp. UYCu712]|uniref:molybdopterin-binding protein n=1 Tax=Arthrobacter sp. UYCu712 TaxID=3156340 RepID=UPI00339A62D8
MTPATPRGSSAAGDSPVPGPSVPGPSLPGPSAAGDEGPGGEEPGETAPQSNPHKHLAHTWQEARQLAFDCAAPLPAAPAALGNALGRTLAADVEALQDIPHYASSAMDGWAVNGSGPWILAEPGQRLAPHQASPIVTGGLIPPGAKAVLRSENGIVAPDEDGLPALKTSGSAKPGEPRNGEHIRKAAEEAAAGELLIKSGTVLNPAHLALAALAGHDTLPVLGKPVVRLVLTGSEVVPSGLPQPGQVRDTFGPQLAGVVGMLGGICSGEVKIGDSYSEWLAALEDNEPPATDPAASGPAEETGLENLPADVVITTGGTGRSGTDHFRRSVAELGGRLLIDGIAMRPGHPAVLAELPDGRFIIGLPGNPLAAMMALSTLAAPLLAALGHGAMPPVGEVPCGSTIEPDPGRTRLMPFRLLYGMASPAQHAGPGMMRGLAAADGVLVVPPHGVQLGEPVPAFALPWGAALPEPGSAGTKAKTPPKRAARKPAGSDGPVDWSALLG